MGEFTALPRPTAGFKGPTAKARKGKERKGKKMGGEERGGEEERKREREPGTPLF